MTSPLVDCAWLEARLASPDLIVLDATIAREPAPGKDFPYSSGQGLFERNGHIPGAQFADLFETFSDPDGAFPFTRPTDSGLTAICRKLGIHADSPIVVYDALSGAWAARVWWVLTAYGKADVRVLNGGLPAWKAAGGKLETGTGACRSPGDFQARLQPGYFVDVPEVLDVVEGRRDAALICATSAAEFRGDSVQPVRRGHIPGGTSLPYGDIVASGTLDPDSVRAAVENTEMPGRETILYCGGGINAAGLALGWAEAGLPRPLIFDGSMNEWKANPALPLEISA